MTPLDQDISPKVDCTQPLVKPDLTNKTAVVTGGAAGIGEAYVRAIVSCGGKAVIADINETNARNLQAELGGEKTVAFSRCDVREWKDQVEAFRAALRLGNGRIDIVINNAGIASQDDIFAGADDDNLDEPSEPAMNTVRVNGLGALMTAKLATFYFRKQSAQDEKSGVKRDYNLVIQSSLYGYLPNLGNTQYAFSKWGQRALFWGYRHSERKYGVRVNMICPWYIRTLLVDDAMAKHLNSSGVDLASLDDAADTLLRILGDEGMNGRSLAIMPRTWKEAPYGVVDFDVDQYEEGTFLKKCVDNGIWDVHRDRP